MYRWDLASRIARFLANQDREETTVREVITQALWDHKVTPKLRRDVADTLKHFGWTSTKTRWKKALPTRQAERYINTALLEARIEKQKTVVSELSYNELADTIAQATARSTEARLRDHAINKLIDEIIRTRFAERIFEQRVAALEAQLRSTDD